MKKKRVEVPSQIVAQVLFLSDRICCVCRIHGKPVQVHHLNNDPHDNSLDNLAVLCFDCHRETQIRGGFDRKLDAEQIALYRDDWKRIVARKRAEIKISENIKNALVSKKIEYVTSIAEIYKENQQYELLAVHYHTIGNTELRDKYIKLVLKGSPDDSTICFLRGLQGRPDLIPKGVVERELLRLTANKVFSQRARLHKELGLNLEAVRDYLTSVSEDLKEKNYFAAAYYLKELAEEGLVDELFILALKKAQDEDNLWWQVRALQELGWKEGLKKLLEANARSIENSDNYFLKLELAKIQNIDKFIEIRKAIAKMESAERTEKITTPKT